MICRKRQPKQPIEESPYAVTPASMISNSFPSTNPDPAYAQIGESQNPIPDPTYAEIDQSQKPASENGDLHNKIPSAIDSQANNGHVVAPSGDLYAQVQKP